jgi:hypothetical protein
MNRFFNERSLGAIVLAMLIILFTAGKAAARQPYLKVVGPPPLRFAVVVAESPQFLQELTLPAFKKDTVTNMPAMQPPAPAVINIAGGISALFPGYRLPLWGGPANSAGVPGNSASDMLSVNSQMIKEYFKQNPKDSDSNDQTQFQPRQTIYVPAELGFVPPSSSNKNK